MKKIVLFVMMMVFSAGFLSQAVYAYSCPSMDEINMNEGDTGAMPCHDPQGHEQSTKHCDGICLCFDLSLNQSITLQNFSAFDAPIFVKTHIFAQDDQLHSISASTLFRPPITLS